MVPNTTRLRPLTTAGWQKHVYENKCTMSSYFHGLDKESRDWYQRKLQLTGLSISDDPYSSTRSGKWCSDMGCWPKIEFADIFSYFISRPGTFTLEQLASWRQLEAYNYFLNNHVRTVFSCTCFCGKCVLLKAKVNPSQRSPDLAHEAWIVAKKGTIVCAHCTCKAG